MLLVVALGLLLTPKQSTFRIAEANALPAMAVDRFDPEPPETDAEIWSEVFEHIRNDLGHGAEESPRTRRGPRSVLDNPIETPEPHDQFLVLAEECIQAITRECVLELAVHLGTEMLAEESGFDNATSSMVSSPFSDLRRQPVMARAFAEALLRYASERDIWFQTESWLTAVASLQSMLGDLEGATTTIGQIATVEQRDAALSYIVEDMTHALESGFGLDVVARGSLAQELLRSALTFAELIETPEIRSDALSSIVRRQVRIGSVADARSTIQEMGPGGNRDTALARLSGYYASAGDVDAAVDIANEIDGERMQSRAIQWAAEAQGLIGPDSANSSLLLALEDLRGWVERTAGDESGVQSARPYTIGDIARAYAELGEIETAVELANSIRNNEDLRANTIADLATIAFRSGGGISLALSIADNSSSQAYILIARARIAWELVQQGDPGSAHALMEEDDASRTADEADPISRERTLFGSVWGALGDVDRALAQAGTGSHDIFVYYVVRQLLSVGDVESARALLIRSVALDFFAEEEINWGLVEAVQALADAQLDAGDRDGAMVTVSVGRNALFWSGSNAPTMLDILTLAGLYARLDQPASARELLTLATSRLLQDDDPTYQLRQLLRIAILMDTL